MEERHMRIKSLKVAGALAALFSFASGAKAQDNVADFYKGKQVNIIVGFAAGGGFDAYARLLARHMTNHMPGRPTFVVRNMFGAAGEMAAGFVANSAPKDGTHIAAVSASQPLARIFVPANQRSYDPAKLHYLGSASKDGFVCLMRPDAPVKTAEDLFRTESVLASGAVGSGTLSYMPLLARNVLGAKFKLIHGYKGTIEVMAALEKGEVHGVCGINLSSVNSQFQHFVKNGVARIVVQEAIEGDAKLNEAKIPRLYDFATTDKQRGIMRAIYAQADFARPFFVAAGVPENRVAALRNAFMATLADKDLIAEAEKMHLTVEPLTGSAIAAIVAEIAQQPDSFIEEVKAAIEIK
jgi:tripartite-type tricarboxylate transporter receptor subunit TctC